jgi:hypothetical protein
MNANIYWRLFLGLIGVCVVGYTAMTLTDLYRYLVLSERTQVHPFEWSVKKRKSDDYRIHGHYTFSLQGQLYSGESAVEEEKFLNPWAAKQAIPRYQKRDWEVWYNPQSAHDSALQKYFPTKECISSVILWGILLYFIWLGYYVHQHGRSRS